MYQNYTVTGIRTVCCNWQHYIFSFLKTPFRSKNHITYFMVCQLSCVSERRVVYPIITWGSIRQFDWM